MSADKHGGIAAGHIGDLIDAPFTAHFVGGCVIGEDQNQGVIDPYHRAWNYPTLHIVDGSTITANLGVNPGHRALTFTFVPASSVFNDSIKPSHCRQWMPSNRCLMY